MRVVDAWVVKESNNAYGLADDESERLPVVNDGNEQLPFILGVVNLSVHHLVEHIELFLQEYGHGWFPPEYTSS